MLGTAGEVLSSVVVGDYQQNMTFTGISRTLENGNVIKQFSYPPPAGSSQTDNVLVNIVFDTLGKVLSATVVNPGTTPTTTTSTATTATTTKPTASTLMTTTPTTGGIVSSTTTVTTSTLAGK